MAAPDFLHDISMFQQSYRVDVDALADLNLMARAVAWSIPQAGPAAHMEVLTLLQPQVSTRLKPRGPTHGQS